MDSDQDKDSLGPIISSAVGAAELRGLAPTLVIAGPDPETGDSRVLLSAPAGRSESRITQAGDVSVNVEGGDPGRSGEATVIHILAGKLRRLGIDCTFAPGVDDRGEDGVLVAGDRRLTVQVVTVLAEPEFWSQAKRGSASRKMTAVDAADVLRSTIDKKGKTVAPAQAGTILLAIDARYAASLISDSILLEYRGRSPSQILRYSFASVWVVGPTADQTKRISDGWP
jgi:hypothetical protein